MLLQGHIPISPYKDPGDLIKLHPIGIPLEMRRIIASHISAYTRQKFSTRILPYKYAVGVDGEMDFIIKSIQLSIEKYIQISQKEERLPTRAVVFADISNKFRSVSRKSLTNIIHSDFPELPPCAFALWWPWRGLPLLRRWLMVCYQNAGRCQLGLSPFRYFAVLVLD